MTEQKEASGQHADEKSFFGIIVHSFFIIPFLIAVFCVLLFVAMRVLTLEQHSAYDYLEDVKTGGLSKRWQAAFELSKILANPELIPDEKRFEGEMISAFEASKTDDNRVRQYLALAMSRAGNPEFVQPLINALADEKEENLYALIYSLGVLKDKKAVPSIYPFLSNANAKVRLASVMALGNLNDPGSIVYLKRSLNDPEPNVSWDAAIALAKLGDSSGREILLNLLNRNYLAEFPEVAPEEQNHILMVVISASVQLKDPAFNAAIKKLAETDPNMKIRNAAFIALDSLAVKK